MSIIQSGLYFLLMLGVLITFHEFGHFWVARRCGIKVLRFSVGFGPALWRWKDKLGTEFVVAALPLGGYVKMVDEREGDVAAADLDGAFNRKSVSRRMAVVVAGPLANFLLAIVTYWVVFMLGVPGLAAVVGEVKPGSIAAAAGLEAGQEIIAVDGRATPTMQALNERLVNRLGDSGTITFRTVYPDSSVESEHHATLDQWDIDSKAPDPILEVGIVLGRPVLRPLIKEVMEGGAAEAAGLLEGDLVLLADGSVIQDWSVYIGERAGVPMSLEVQRGDQVITVVVTPEAAQNENDETVGRLGVAYSNWQLEKYGPVGAIAPALRKTWDTSAMTLGFVKKMVMGDISVKHLSGPITIAKVAGDSAGYGLVPYLLVLALLSVSLGVLNLLPIPVLDGGHLAYYVVEAVKGSPLSDRVQELGYRLGLFMVIGLMVAALYNDILRL
ncbi:MAG: RIP metalloprotease RseP [Porticoccaceae bacterium]